jgi:acyl carrier protein
VALPSAVVGAMRGYRQGEPMDLRERLRAVFVEALGLNDDIEVQSLRYRDIPQWDSIGHMTLVAAIEDEFGVALDTEQVIDLSSFDIAEALLRKLGAAE